jgi:protein-tyrosine-phosphatase
MAEAILNRKSKGLFRAESAGSRPAARVNQYAIETMSEFGIDWRGHPPRSVDGLEREPWDFVITVCDKAKESCPVFPGQPILAHWGMPDPAEVVGDADAKRKAFRDAFFLISRRIDLLLALPFRSLEKLALQARVEAIGGQGAPAAENPAL